MKGIVVVPTYNESANVVSLIDSILQQPIQLDIMIVDDGSPDGTADLVKSHPTFGDRVHLLSRTGLRGFGPSYVDGFKKAIDQGYEVICCMDADFSHDPSKLPELVQAVEDTDVAVGFRYCNGNVSVVNWPLRRLFLSVFAGVYVRLITGLRVSDPTTGFRAFRTPVLQSIRLDTMGSNGYAFLVELIYRVHRAGFKIREVPIIFVERREGQSKMSKKIILEATLMPWRLRFKRFKASRV